MVFGVYEDFDNKSHDHPPNQEDNITNIVNDQDDSEQSKTLPPLNPLPIVNITSSLDTSQLRNIRNNSENDKTNSSSEIEKLSFVEQFKQLSEIQQASIISALNISHDNASTPLSTPKTHNIIKNDLDDSSDSDESVDNSTLIKSLMQSVSNLALNQSRLLDHQQNPKKPFIPVISEQKNITSTSSREIRQARLTKKLIEAADRVNAQKLKLFQVSARGRCLKFKQWIRDITNLLHMFTCTQNILLNYPRITDIPKPYINAAVYTFINSFVELEGKNVIKGVIGNGHDALILLQTYCARVTNDNILSCVHNFNNTKIFPSESAVCYIARFHDAYLSAQSVGLHLDLG